MLSLSEKIDSYVTAMPAGNVTVMKLSANSSAVSIGAISVLLPSALVRHSSAGANLMLLATEMTSDVANKLPRGKAGSVDEISLRSGILDLSLAQEASGRVSLILVDGTEAILFRLATEPPITGDACLFFDPNLDAWSSDGVAMLTDWELEDLGLNGSWCASNHTSFFAVAQTIPFSDMLDSEELVQDSAAAGILAGLACCALFIPGFLVFRRLGTPHAGQIWLKSQGRQGREVREVHFSCKLVLTEPSPEADSPTRSLSQKSALSAATAESDLSPRMKADSPKRSISRQVTAVADCGIKVVEAAQEDTGPVGPRPGSHDEGLGRFGGAPGAELREGELRRLPGKPPQKRIEPRRLRGCSLPTLSSCRAIPDGAIRDGKPSSLKPHPPSSGRRGSWTSWKSSTTRRK